MSVIKNIFIITCLAIIFPILFFILPLHVNRVVEQDEYVVKYNTWTNQFDNDHILTQGRYATPFGVEFFKFKRTLQNIELDELECMTMDKVILRLNVILQIQYYPEYLIGTVLRQYGTNSNYKNLIVTIANSTILNTCLQWSVEQYYMDRSKIDNSMYLELVSNINKTTIQTQVVFFQLVDIKFPDSYSDLIKEKQNIEQNKQTALNDRTNKLTQAQTQIVINQKNAQINIVNANMTSNILLNKAYTVGEQIIKLWEFRTNYLYDVKKKLDLNPSQLLDYIKQEKISSTQSIIVNVQKNEY
jgi:regulator of protease activity HflC (stomatin/prohibitin superfamily)